AEDGILTYTNSLGAKQPVNLSDIVSEKETLTKLSYDPDEHTITYVDDDGISHPLDLSVGKLLYDPTTNKLTYTAEDGTPTEIPLNETGLEYEAEDGILTYTNSLGVEQNVDLSAANIAYDNAASNLLANNVQAAIDELTQRSDVFTDNGDGTFTHKAADGTEVKFDANTTTFTDNQDGTYTFINDNGDSIKIDTNAEATNGLEIDASS